MRLELFSHTRGRLAVLYHEPVIAGGHRAAVVGAVPSPTARGHLLEQLAEAVEYEHRRARAQVHPRDVPAVVVAVPVGREERRVVQHRDRGARQAAAVPVPRRDLVPAEGHPGEDGTVPPWAAVKAVLVHPVPGGRHRYGVHLCKALAGHGRGDRRRPALDDLGLAVGRALRPRGGGQVRHRDPVGARPGGDVAPAGGTRDVRTVQCPLEAIGGSGQPRVKHRGIDRLGTVGAHAEHVPLVETEQRQGVDPQGHRCHSVTGGAVSAVSGLCVVVHPGPDDLGVDQVLVEEGKRVAAFRGGRLARVIAHRIVRRVLAVQYLCLYAARLEGRDIAHGREVELRAVVGRVTVRLHRVVAHLKQDVQAVGIGAGGLLYL